MVKVPLNGRNSILKNSVFFPMGHRPSYELGLMINIFMRSKNVYKQTC
jgi:hypothetical protein